ncbi:hypothetical protein V491_08675, partial [Pseudogymnoascus sp. VKM F-3775]
APKPGVDKSLLCGWSQRRASETQWILACVPDSFSSSTPPPHTDATRPQQPKTTKPEKGRNPRPRRLRPDATIGTTTKPLDSVSHEVPLGALSFVAVGCPVTDLRFPKAPLLPATFLLLTFHIITSKASQ